MTITQVPSAPLVAVVGATGMQGGSVVKALAESDKPYRIRGFTRNATKPASEALKKQGVEVVEISLVLDNVKEVYRAFIGANVAFLVTNFWEHIDMEKEVSEGKMLIDAAKAAGVERIVWSGLVSPTKISGGKLTHVYHFHGKSLVSEYGYASGVPFVNVQAGFYASNFLANPSMLAKQSDGTFAIAWNVKPTTVVPLIDCANDYGLYVRHVLELAVFPDGSEVYTTSEDITLQDMVRQLSEVTGKDVVFKQLTDEEFGKNFSALGLPPPVVTEMVEGFQFFDEYGYYGGQPSASREGLARPTRTWTEFAKLADWSKAFV
ncbi:NAD(P)-binding protein [Mycena maculata]|uniref:NAD(P)-binding protein n=1 Tax=Mycena maculata TaxID=230809 RepID=A0AAD7NSE8_9AGAR|nr:NAD(P)-binding protein [Mycena maculata]